MTQREEIVLAYENYCSALSVKKLKSDGKVKDAYHDCIKLTHNLIEEILHITDKRDNQNGIN